MSTTRVLNLYRKLPDYYDTMYLDGYSFEEVMEASRRTSHKRIKALLQEKEQKKLSADMDKRIQEAIIAAVEKALKQ
ncbi:MAG: hypothetical protein IKV41_04375 [Oscillospiraceae bacterium]|nr:hypothetical protein [Oscillospiraceae bacterium]